MTRTAALLLAATTALTACAIPPDGGDPNENRTRTGAIGGAVLGGLLGLSQGGEVDDVALGAVAGAAIGGVIGAELDRQAAELRADLANERVSIVNTGSELVVTMPEDILFDFDSTVIKPGLRTDLATLATSLQKYPNTTVDVIGHTDNVGSASYNQTLSIRRAEQVRNVLRTNGVAGERLRVLGRGATAPIASNDTDAGRAQNRRVEIIIRPNAA